LSIRYHDRTLGESHERKLDRLVEFDDRSRLFPIRALLPPQSKTEKVRRKRLWTPGDLLDQTTTPGCVGFGWSAEYMATPVKGRATDASAFKWYHTAQTLDPWKDQPHEGSTVLAGAKAGVELGYLKSYHWCFSIDDVIDTLVLHSPVVMGTSWLGSMFETDERGFLVVDPSSGDEGGHCWVLRGFIPKGHLSNPLPAKDEDVFVMRQSWGLWGWKNTGDARMRRSGVEYLLKNEGEACVATDIKLAKAA
jgi:hypothetical protein